MIIIPFNPNNCHWILVAVYPNNCHWILVVVSIKERTIAVMDLLVKNTVWADTSVHKGVDVGLEIIR